MATTEYGDGGSAAHNDGTNDCLDSALSGADAALAELDHVGEALELACAGTLVHGGDARNARALRWLIGVVRHKVDTATYHLAAARKAQKQAAGGPGPRLRPVL